jgi:hypothetical protein
MQKIHCPFFYFASIRYGKTFQRSKTTRFSFHTFIFIFNIKDVCNSPNKHSLEHELFYGSFHILI